MSKKILIIMLSILIIVISAIIFFSQVSTHKNTQEFVVNQLKKDIKYQEIKDKNPAIVYNPNSNILQVKEYNKNNNPKPVIHSVKYSSSTPLTDITIKAGDSVNFINYSDKNITINGDDWGSSIQIEPGKSFLQTFDFKGQFVYKINADAESNSKIIVE